MPIKYYVMKDGKAVRQTASLDDSQGEDEGKIMEIDEPESAADDGDVEDMRLLVIHEEKLKRLFKPKDTKRLKAKDPDA
ncbi:MAG TPA: hypothetical protein VMW91_01080 [Desulfosporosinus sp.]|nr:hypothetical protein [Desulfosporosinus sp.]